MLQIYPYQCDCGWSTKYLTGGFRRMVPLAQRVENQLVKAKHVDARAVWRKIYQMVIIGEIPADSIKIREGYISCFYCKDSQSQIALFDSDNQLLHPILCNQCGKEGYFSQPSDPTVCPMCENTVTTGEVFPINEQIRRLLQKCQLTLSNQTPDHVVLVIGERSSKDLKPFLNNIPFITIQEGEKNNEDMDLINLLSNRKRVFLHTYFETPLATRLTLLLVEHLFMMNIEVISIIGSPSMFEGKRRIERVMGYIHELQSYCAHTILVSSSIRKEFDHVMEVFEQHIPSQIMEVINRYSKEQDVLSQDVE